MENEFGKYVKSFGLSFAITSFISALLVLLKESNEDTVLKWMAGATGHHWVTHGIIDIILFVVLGWILAMPNNGKGVNISVNALAGSIVVSTVVSTLLIAGFFI